MKGSCNIANFIWTQTTRNISFRGRLDLSVYPRQLINHFKNHGEISSKLNLFVNMHETCIEYGLDVFNFIPMTFIFIADSPDFTAKVLHFFRFFKGLEIYNFLRKKKIQMTPNGFKSFYKKSQENVKSRSEIMNFQNKQTMKDLNRLRTRSRSIQKSMKNTFRNESVNVSHQNHFAEKKKTDDSKEDSDKIKKEITKVILIFI